MLFITVILKERFHRSQTGNTWRYCLYNPIHYNYTALVRKQLWREFDISLFGLLRRHSVGFTQPAPIPRYSMHDQSESRMTQITHWRWIQWLLTINPWRSGNGPLPSALRSEPAPSLCTSGAWVLLQCTLHPAISMNATANADKLNIPPTTHNNAK